MPSARPAFRLPTAARNAGFAKHARNFANRALALPGFPVLPIAGLAAGILMVVVGAFGTGEMPLATRIAFWAVLLGWNVLKWQAWFALLVRRPRDWPRTAAIGALVLNLPLPIEISLALRLFGIDYAPQPSRTWSEALAISAAIFLVLIIAGIGRRMTPAAASVATPPSAVTPDGLLDRAGLNDPAALHAIEAEDHYCRLHLAGGRSLLVLHRFGDALAEVAGYDGAQVHRGAWVAASGVAGARRDGRRWLLLLADGAEIPVSASFAATARDRGWLRVRR
ncbi:MAG: LytTR family transcriptional regulator DNA-binding domain-containing protein [Sphingomonas sp.]|jgi:hypothetical protein|uniref:LytTR family DNA-binding domain-containing protein n=1 Tax=Sphingomonas sp. TaxID=28214 RepID=UPI003561E223